MTPTMVDLLKVEQPTPGIAVLGRDGKLEGKTTGAAYACQMDGCTGRRMGVRWPDGKITYPCSKGMDFPVDRWRIL